MPRTAPDRVESMMFIGTIITDEKGKSRKD
jgi:hypothetical protein